MALFEYDGFVSTELPNCLLTQNLQERANQRRDVTFDYQGELRRFKERVSAEIRQINELFPEYTPHDDKYHISRLFHIADKVLGQQLISGLNASELFVLACSLYGHDWGMAVSEAEKHFIVRGVPPAGRHSNEFGLLPNESERFKQFLKEHSPTNTGENGDVPVAVWREYVRQTHAARSGQRARLYFEPQGGGLGEAITRACEGHWIDFEKLQDYYLYPPDFSVLGESINLRALAVYVRLIDLLDIADDRTPFVIWKFVAPRDPVSKMEWAKHRALNPIACPPYQAGRSIQIDGSTDDYEVYAALEDLHAWIQEQFKGCMDTLHRLNDPRHRLDLYQIDWRVAARGFDPISIRFEFERSSVFEILSNYVYQGDSHVFLRELLQNSIDAIHVRREILQRKGAGVENVGVIRVDVEHKDNGDCELSWSDDGSGMDEYIVKNYLSMVGRSYYRSTDFEREGLSFDPISRFGIGLLSCFMVADRVDIKTYRDPYISQQSKPLHIEIPSVLRQFRTSSHPHESAQVGTQVKVHVKGEKLKKVNMKEVKNL